MKCPKCGSEDVKATVFGRKWQYYLCLHCRKQIKIPLMQIAAQDYCASESPNRRIFCQLPKGHSGSHRAVIFWEEEAV